ncbi:MAG: hypothetical protein NTW12_07140 [Deltaproteobacteria bacterium]|nr:hypothetical protein [Deltaproteobacteria bacterium]
MVNLLILSCPAWKVAIPLDFAMLKGKKKQDYFFAVQSGLTQTYELMEKIFGEVIEWTLRQRRQSYR